MFVTLFKRASGAGEKDGKKWAGTVQELSLKIRLFHFIRPSVHPLLGHKSCRRRSAVIPGGFRPR